jgi:hypothetical protein
MKPLLTAAILAVVTLILGATLVLTCDEPSSISPSFKIPSPDRSFVFSKPTPIYPDKLPTTYPLSPPFNTLSTDRSSVFSKPPPIYLDKSPTSQPLPPGVYQTYPYTIILIVPGRGIDDRIVVEPPNANSKMPRIKPPMKVIPLSPAKP